jgi:hypothetical protein
MSDDLILRLQKNMNEAAQLRHAKLELEEKLTSLEANIQIQTFQLLEQLQQQKKRAADAPLPLIVKRAAPVQFEGHTLSYFLTESKRSGICGPLFIDTLEEYLATTKRAYKNIVRHTACITVDENGKSDTLIIGHKNCGSKDCDLCHGKTLHPENVAKPAGLLEDFAVDIVLDPSK